MSLGRSLGNGVHHLDPRPLRRFRTILWIWRPVIVTVVAPAPASGTTTSSARSTSGSAAFSVHEPGGESVSIWAVSVDFQVFVIGETLQEVAIVGVSDEYVYERIVPSDGVEPFDPAHAEIEMFLERRPGGRKVGRVQVPEEGNPWSHWKKERVVCPVWFSDVNPSSVRDHQFGHIVGDMEDSPSPR
jgi:hypothetical protein